MSTSWALKASFAALLGTLSCVLLACGDSQSPGPPNVLLISLDTLRADHLSCYGYERKTSPAIDRLAAEGVLFERTFSTTSWTLPSHLSLFTGLELSVHGICDERLWTALEGQLLPMRGEFLAERFSDAGYATAGFHTAPYLDEKFGFGAGFDRYERVGHSVYTHPLHSERFKQLREAGDTEALKAWMKSDPDLFDDHRPTADEAVDAALEWITGRGENPYFCFLHIFDIHNDYVPPPPFDTQFDAEYQGLIDGRRVTGKNSPVHSGMSPRDLEHLIALYDGEIAWVDSQIARLVARLEELGQLENTLVVVTSDHGEEFFEHGEKGHRNGLHTESLHVPLIMRWPAGLPEGVKVSQSTGLVDIAPTLSALCGLDAIPASGVDLTPLMHGEHLRERRYVSELLLFEQLTDVPVRRLSILEGRQHSLIEASPMQASTCVVYDLASDPAEAGTGRLAEVPSLDGVRKRFNLLRDAAHRRNAEASPLTPEQLAEITAAGYAGDDDPSAGSERERLCLDGCVWHDE